MSTNRTKPNPIRSRAAAVVVLGVALSVGITSATASHPTAAKDVPSGSVTTAKLRDGAVTTPKLHNGAATTAKIRDGAVATPKLQKNAVTGPKINAGAVGPTKLAPAVVAPRAVGTIWWTGTSVSNNRNLTTANVSRPGEGIYCISGLPFTPINALATSSFGWNAGEQEVHVWTVGSSQGIEPCPAGTQIQVRLYDLGTSTLSSGNFNIMIF